MTLPKIMPVTPGEAVHMREATGPCEIHDWPDDGLPARLIARMRERHGKGGISACTDCLTRAVARAKEDRASTHAWNPVNARRWLKSVSEEFAEAEGLEAEGRALAQNAVYGSDTEARFRHLIARELGWRAEDIERAVHEIRTGAGPAAPEGDTP